MAHPEPGQDFPNIKYSSLWMIQVLVNAVVPNRLSRLDRSHRTRVQRRYKRPTRALCFTSAYVGTVPSKVLRIRTDQNDAARKLIDHTGHELCAKYFPFSHFLRTMMVPHETCNQNVVLVSLHQWWNIAMIVRGRGRRQPYQGVDQKRDTGIHQMLRWIVPHQCRQLEDWRVIWLFSSSTTD